MGKESEEEAPRRREAYRFIFLLGLVSLFGDITYEGARGVSGPFLSILGASATVVGLVAGFGEFFGYGLRIVSGHLVDRTGRHWAVVFLGYGLLLSIPLLALAGRWEVAAFFFLLERMGKAIRTPARDTLLSHATSQVGRGWGFGIHEALDQVGAFLGPLIFSAVLYLGGGYRVGFAVLFLPALLTLSALALARVRIPAPEKFEAPIPHSRFERDRLPEVFWLYILFISASVAGYATFPLIAYHFKVHSVLSDPQIPILYAVAMGVDAGVALLIGKTYDRIGLVSLIAVPLLTLPTPLLLFSRTYSAVLVGVVLWGAVMGIQETVMRAAIADLAPLERRGTAYGIFNAAYGASWLLGSAAMGFLYDRSIASLVLFAVGMELLSVPLFLWVKGSLSKVRAEP
jgi:MFS family permease